MPKFKKEDLDKMIEQYLKPKMQGRPEILERLMQRRRKERLEMPKVE